MMNQVKKNRALIVMLSAAVFTTFVSFDFMVNKKKYESPRVPSFQVPKELAISVNQSPLYFPRIKKTVLLGGKPAVKVAPVSITHKTAPRLRRLTVKAIMIDGEEKIANINGVILKVGEYIHGRTILKIEKNHVLVSGPKGQRIIQMHD